MSRQKIGPPWRLFARALAIAVLSVAGSVLSTNASIVPSTLSTTLQAGKSVSEHKCVTIPDLPPSVDVLLSFDLTGSMGGVIALAKANAIAVVDQLRASGSDFRFAVVSYMDYPQSYGYTEDNCGYADGYGVAGVDHAYLLVQSMTGDADVVSAAINSMAIGNGLDGPQDYTRIFYESYADPGVGWRSGAKRIHLNFGDNVPHDCDLDDGTGLWPFGSTGGDPGRDEVMGTADDLDLQAVLAQMATENITLLEAHTGGDTAGGLWALWTGVTGGHVFDTTAGDFVGTVVAEILAAAVVPVVNGLTLQASAGYEGWLTLVVPPSYDGVLPGEERCFDIEITVPEGTVDGTYEFTISAVDDGEVSYGDQAVTIEVVSTVWVTMDIKFTSNPNAFNCRRATGVVPVTIFGTDDVDVTQIDLGTVKLALASDPTVWVGPPAAWSVADRGAPADAGGWVGTPDGWMDLDVAFQADAVANLIGCGTLPRNANSAPLIIMGSLLDGTAFQSLNTDILKNVAK